METFGDVATEIPKILVVDDRKENLVATRKALKSIDADIIEAESGNEALSLMLHHTFACVLLDVQMPEMDGFEVATLMREQDQMKDIPIIFATAISKEEKYVDQAAELGAVDYIFKPINPNILKSKVQVYVDLHVKQQQLNELNNILARNNDELERFAYICSHDLQEPARMMGSFSELLEKDYQSVLDDKGKNYLNFVRKNSVHMQSMINDILTFSRVGRESIKCEDVDSNSVLNEIKEEFQKQLEETKATITSNGLPVVQTSPTLMRVLLQNLISNGLKYQKGNVQPAITVSATEDERNWTFSVVDNGIGIDPEHKDKVFSMFQRIHRKDKYPGTGIGLSTCQKFVELYGGNIWFESEPEKGTTFLFTIPKLTGKEQHVAA